MTTLIQLWPSIYTYPDHLVLFEEATLISTVNGLPQYFKEANEIKNNNI